MREPDQDVTTYSGVELEPVYGPPEAERPGEYPYTRGPYAEMYRSKLWTMRMFAGFGTAADTNQRFKDLLAAGGDGLSTAFDLPTLMGRDSDDPLALGEVGKCGVAIDTLADVEDLFADIDLGTVTTSMTINSPAPMLLAMYLVAAEHSGVERARLGGTLQNDILKEYQAQKEYFFPPRPSMRLVSDVMRVLHRGDAALAPGLDLRATTSAKRARRPRRSSRSRSATGSRTWRPALAAGLAIDDFAPRLSFFFNAHIDFFEEIAKYRAARRIWARWMRERYGATSERSLQMRFHTQTAGVSLTAQQPEVNLVRTAIEALAGVLGGTQSLHTNSFDEALALPTEKAARLALRTQQVIAHETGVTNVADPLGGSWFVEELTDEMERQAEAMFAHVDELGGGSMLEGALVGVEQGWFQGEIAQAAYDIERKLNDGRHVMVGVNALLRGQRRRAARHARDRTRVRGDAAQAARGGEGRSRLGRGRRARSPACAPTRPTRRRT